MCNGIVCNCDGVTHGPILKDGSWINTCGSGLITERPGEQIKRRVEETRDEIKRMLNSLVDELGVQIEEIYVEVEDKTKISDVSIYWYVQEN